MLDSEIAGQLLELGREMHAVILSLLELAHTAVNLEHFARPHFLVGDLLAQVGSQEVASPLKEEHL